MLVSHTQLQQDNEVATDWEKILTEIDKQTIPPSLIRKINFLYNGSDMISLDVDDLDAESLREILDVLETEDNQPESAWLVIDLVKLADSVTNYTDMILINIPKFL